MNRFRFQVPRSPMLLLYGDRDGALETEFLESVITALPPGSRSAVILEAGHFLQIDQPQAVCEAILEYLGSEQTHVERTGGSGDFA